MDELEKLIDGKSVSEGMAYMFMAISKILNDKGIATHQETYDTLIEVLKENSK